MEIIQAISNTGQLCRESVTIRFAGIDGGGAYQKNTINVLVILDISHGFPVRHPLRHDLGRINRHAKTHEDILMIQLCPHRDIPEEFLNDVSQRFAPAKGKGS